MLQISNFFFAENLAHKVLFQMTMSAYESIYKKMASSLEGSGEGSARELAATFDPQRHVAPIVAHELNNILTIVQGYADRLLLRHGEDPALLPHLRLISEAAHRAAIVVREATPSNANETFRQSSQTAQPV
jgi:signal transduction histidine kinase